MREKIDRYADKRMAACQKKVDGWTAEMAAAKRNVRWTCTACGNDHRIGDTSAVIPLTYSKIDGYWYEGSQPQIEVTCPTCYKVWRTVNGHSPEYSKFFTMRDSFLSLDREEREYRIFHSPPPKDILK